MVKRFPLLRGKGINKPKRPPEVNINLDDLQLLEENTLVDVKLLVDKGIIAKEAMEKGVKILSGGKLEKKLRVKLPVSKKAKAAIEKAGGIVEI